MRFLRAAFFLLSFIPVPAFALNTLLGDEEEGLYFDWPEREWRLEREEKKEKQQRVSLIKITQGIYLERAFLSAEPLPQEGFSTFFNTYLEKENKKTPGLEVKVLSENIKGEYDNRIFILYDTQQPCSASVNLIIQGQRFIYCVRKETDNSSDIFVRDSTAFLLKARILDSKNVSLIRKKVEKEEEEKVKQEKGVELKAIESDLKELDALVGEEVNEEEAEEKLIVFKVKKQDKALKRKSLNTKESSGEKEKTEKREFVGETAVTSETEKLSIVWDSVEDWTLLPKAESKEEGMEEEVPSSDKEKSIKVYHSTENEENWTETGEIKISGGPLKEKESPDEQLEENIQKIFKKELQSDPKAYLNITEDRFTEALASRIFIIKTTKKSIPNIYFYLILFGKKGLYEINRKKRGGEAFTVSEKKYIDFLKTAALTDTGLAGDEATGDKDESMEDSETADQDGSGSEDGMEENEDLETGTDTDTITDIITETSTETGTETNTKTGTGTGTGTRKDTDTKTRTDTDTITDIITETNTETGTETNTKTGTETGTETRTGTGTGTGTKTGTDTRTDTDTITEIITSTETGTETNTKTRTETSIYTQTRTSTKTGTSTSTSTKTGTATSTATKTSMDTKTGTSTHTGRETSTGTDTDTRKDTSTITGTGTSTDTEISEKEAEAMAYQEDQEGDDKINKMFDDQRRSLIKKHLENVYETKADYESTSDRIGGAARRDCRLNAEEQDWGQVKITINDIEKRRKETNDSRSEAEEEE